VSIPLSAISYQLSAISWSKNKEYGMQDFRNLDVWQRARKLNKTIYQATADFPKSEMFGLRSQIRRA